MNKAPAIIPPERIIESVSNMKLEGYFEVELIHKPTGLIKRQLRFKNLITTAGLEWIGDVSPSTRQDGVGFTFGRSNGYMGVGTGTAEPAITDTALQAQVARTQSQGSPTIAATAGSGPSYDYWWYKTTKVFLPGVGTGNLTEVGVFNASSGGTMWARQLFRDGLGNATTIVKTADDELRITYELRIYPMKTSNVSTITLKSVERTCTTRGYDIDSDGRWGSAAEGGGSMLTYFGRRLDQGSGDLASYSSSIMPALTDVQTGTATAPSTSGWGGYSAATYYKDHSMTWNPGLGNLTMGSIKWGGVQGYNSPFITTIEPAVSKTDTERFTFTGRVAWGRV